MTRYNAVTRYTAAAGFLLCFALCPVPAVGQSPARPLRIEQAEGAIRVYREGDNPAILTQNALPDKRPYLHPIVAPDGKGVITEYRPAHHLHQTGIFWGFKLVNGRDFFMQWQSEHYRRVSATVIEPKGQRVRWQTVYMLDENGNTAMTETQNWSMAESGGRYVLDLEWKGVPKTDMTLGKWYVGGLFVRMPWHMGSRAEAVTARGQRGQNAEQQRAEWTDVGIQVEGRDDLAHIVIFDHPDNYGSPVPWRVDSQMGFGPNTEPVERRLEKGKTEVFRYRLIAYTGDFDAVGMTRAWKEFVREKQP